MEVPMAQEKSEQIFFTQPKVHQFKFADLNKMVPIDQLKLTAFFEQCQATNKAAASEVQSKMIFMGHQISSCHVPVVRSLFILWKMLLSS
jgi:hypothetical protein